MKFATVASHDRKELRYLLSSCEHFGIEMEVLGLNQPYLGNGSKIVYLSKFLQTLDRDDIICFTDAYDSFFIRNLDGLEETFRSFNHPAVFTAEDNYYFRLTSTRMVFLNRYVRWRYPKSQGSYKKYRFLNSGGFIGYVGHIQELIKKLGIEKTMYSDQPRFHMHFINHPEDITLDYSHKIFTMYGKYAGPETFGMDGDTIKNNNTNTEPYIMHFPGKIHPGLEEWAEKIPWVEH